MKKLVLVIRAYEVGPRMGASSANQGRGPSGRFTVQENVQEDSIDTDRHGDRIG